MRFKKAFTLGEALLVFIIIGIIAAIGMSTVKPWQKSYKYSYSRMYNALSLAVYNHMINSTEEESFPDTADMFCLALLDWINTSNNATACEGSNVGLNPTTFDDDKVRFTASNGTKIWIGSNPDDSPFVLSQHIDATTIDTVRYYMVFVDINGDRGPNTPEWKKTQMADIVAFAVTDKFKVIPLGYPEVDGRYLTAHVVYPALETTYSDNMATDSFTGDEEIVSDPMSYYEAKIKAYGNSVIAGNIETYDFRSIFGANNSYFKVDNYNDYYETPPQFDSVSCQFQADNPEPVCNVRIYDYH